MNHITDEQIDRACKEAGLRFNSKTKGLKAYVRVGWESVAIKRALECMPAIVPAEDRLPLALMAANHHYNGYSNCHLNYTYEGDFFKFADRNALECLWRDLRPNTLNRWKLAVKVANELRGQEI